MCSTRNGGGVPCARPQPPALLAVAQTGAQRAPAARASARTQQFDCALDAAVVGVVLAGIVAQHGLQLVFAAGSTDCEGGLTAGTQPVLVCDCA
eukprot:CAMPEP_0179437698 /NCGR_PEP_ID=MMETSP0799-20121207/21546_1 /TAXON_ID=46947 /ORGANISM="Geminigera cryophila, Strain CCMP2564" /LENGTH=93 /DNA_ID=CAMNT_0021218805 /DNA_START=1213 /DNA_END=1494 /DNA_ORIENTATION=+